MAMTLPIEGRRQGNGVGDAARSDIPGHPAHPGKATQDDGYVVLAAEPQVSTASGWSSTQRSVIVSSGIAACLLNSGLVFGYSALYPQLLELGVFRDLCPPGQYTCRRQLLGLSGMFTVATSSLNIASMPGGAILDLLGPRITSVIMALLVAAGCALFACGGPGPWHLAYTGGFLLMAVAGPQIFVATLSFPNLYPGREGLITAALVGCFDASSAVFIGLAGLLARGVPLPDVFRGYAVFPIVIAIIAAASWPRAPVSPLEVRAAPAAAPAGNAAPGPSGAGGASASPGPKGPDGTAEKSPVAGSPSPAVRLAVDGLEAAPLMQKMLSAEFWLLTYAVCTCMVWLNFWIATAYEQLATVDPATAHHLAQAFSVLLPLGGFVYVPFIGTITDCLGPAKGWVVLLVSVALCCSLGLVYVAIGSMVAAYAAFAVFAFCRPLFYTLSAAFTSQVFGMATFGTMYGLLFTLAGLANLLVQPLTALAGVRGFGLADGLVVVALVPSMTLPVRLLLRSSAKALPVSQAAQTRERINSGASEGLARVSVGHKSQT